MSEENVEFLRRAGKILRYQEFYDEQAALAVLEG
jgi:hypothetical protein